MESSKFVLLLWEVQYHPNSYVAKLCGHVETPSVLRITRKEELRKYKVPPLFDRRYLVLFESLRCFEDNSAYLDFKIMFPILQVETKGQLDDAIFFFQEKNIPYQFYHNDFTKEDARLFVRQLAKSDVSDTFCKAVVSHVGCNPIRITAAVNTCDQLGYSVRVLHRYVDKWVYLDRRKLIDSLLGVAKSRATVKTAYFYLQMNRNWYKSVVKSLVGDLDLILQIYQDRISGDLRDSNLFDYIETNKVTRSQVIHALSLFDKVSITKVILLREFLKQASIMDVVLMLADGRTNVS